MTFAPQSSGLVNGGITISDNGSNPTVSISLSDTGVFAGTVAANPASLSFGTVQVGSNTNLSGTLTNSGSSSVTISQANVTGSAFAVNGLSHARDSQFGSEYDVQRDLCAYEWRRGERQLGDR